jgi:hypothetical protein
VNDYSTADGWLTADKLMQNKLDVHPTTAVATVQFTTRPVWRPTEYTTHRLLTSERGSPTRRNDLLTVVVGATVLAGE